MDEYHKERKSQREPLEDDIKPPVVPLADFNKLQQKILELQERLHKESPAVPELTPDEDETQHQKGAGKGKKVSVATGPYDGGKKS